jgi:hypothetical protein
MACISNKGAPQVSTGVDSASTVARISLSSCILLGIFALLLMLLLFGIRTVSNKCVDDFTGFIIGAKLLGTRRLYDVSSNLALQKQIVGVTEPGVIFVRPPFWALAMKPFLALPYHSAVFIWRWFMAGALVAFAVISADRRVGLALCSSVPAAGAIAAANDVPLILLLVGISLACRAKGWRVVSGMALGLCLAKFHFLAFVPLVLLHREYRRELQGFLSVAALLIAVNFAVQPDWIALYWHGLNIPEANMSVRAAMMPNVYSVFSWTGHPGVAVIVGGFAMATLLWRACGWLPFEVAIPLCIFSATLAAPHTNYLDGVLAIPAIFASVPYLGSHRKVAWLLLSPIAGLLVFFGPPVIGPAVVVAASLWLLWRVASQIPSAPLSAGVGTLQIAGNQQFSTVNNGLSSVGYRQRGPTNGAAGGFLLR